MACRLDKGQREGTGQTESVSRGVGGHSHAICVWGDMWMEIKECAHATMADDDDDVHPTHVTRKTRLSCTRCILHTLDRCIFAGASHLVPSGLLISAAIKRMGVASQGAEKHQRLAHTRPFAPPQTFQLAARDSAGGSAQFSLVRDSTKRDGRIGAFLLENTKELIRS